jgi:hypothetical protein
LPKPFIDVFLGCQGWIDPPYFKETAGQAEGIREFNCRERALSRSDDLEKTLTQGSRNATEGVPYKAAVI